MSTISSLGVGSGLDLSSLLDSLTEAEEAKLEPITTKQESYNAKLSAYGTLQSALTTFQTAADALNDTSLYQGVSATTSSSAFTATADSTAVDGNYSVSVEKLAQTQSLAAGGVDSTSTKLATTDTTISLTLGDGSTTDIDISSDASSLEGIRDAINAAGAGVTATIVNNGDAANPYQLVLSSDATGTNAAVTEISVSGDSSLSSMLSYPSDDAGAGMTETVPAQNAELTVNGIKITSQSNTVQDAIQGVTLNLTETTSSAQPLSLAKDTDTVKSAITDFVSAYNTLMSTVKSLRSVDTEDSDNSGVLVGDSTLSRIESKVKSAMTAQTDTSDSYSYLAQIGVSLQKDGTLAVEDSKLDKALSSNLEEVASLLAGTGKSSSDGVIGGLSSTLSQILDTNGILANATSGIESTLDDLSKQEERMQSTIDATIARYKAQFTQLDVLMSSLNSTSDYLTQQFEAMNNTSNS